jgi:hypothetical protein
MDRLTNPGVIQTKEHLEALQKCCCFQEKLNNYQGQGIKTETNQYFFKE